jgi:hypothetical protein
MLTVTQSPSVVLLPNQAVTPQLPSKKDIRLEAGDFVARLALTEEERAAAYRLRFLVFNLEMNEGLESAYVDGYDKDHFDDVCDHMIVEDLRTGAIVGTYRMQMGEVAGKYFGYYSEQEFCFAPYEAMRSQIVELGRACIHREYRSSDVLHLLWRGIQNLEASLPGRSIQCFVNLLTEYFASSPSGPGSPSGADARQSLWGQNNIESKKFCELTCRRGGGSAICRTGDRRLSRSKD